MQPNRQPQHCAVRWGLDRYMHRDRSAHANREVHEISSANSFTSCSFPIFIRHRLRLPIPKDAISSRYAISRITLVDGSRSAMSSAALTRSEGQSQIMRWRQRSTMWRKDRTTASPFLYVKQPNGRIALSSPNHVQMGVGYSEICESRRRNGLEYFDLLEVRGDRLYRGEEKVGLLPQTRPQSIGRRFFFFRRQS